MHPPIQPRGHTALIFASGRGRSEIVVRLLEAGASPAITTVTGDTAVSMGEGRISDEAFESLKEATRGWVASNGGRHDADDFRNSEDAKLAQQEVRWNRTSRECVCEELVPLLFFLAENSSPASPASAPSQHIRHCKHCQARLREQLPYRRNEERERRMEEKGREIEQRLERAMEVGGDALADALLKEADALSAAEGMEEEPLEIGIEGLVLGAEEEEERAYLPMEFAMTALLEKRGGDAVLRLLEACGSERMGRRLAAQVANGDATQDKMKYLTGTSFVGAVVATLVRTTRMSPHALEEVSMESLFSSSDAHLAMELAVTKATAGGKGLSAEDYEQCEEMWKKIIGSQICTAKGSLGRYPKFAMEMSKRAAVRRVQCRTVPSKNLLEGHVVDSVVSPSSGDGHADAAPEDDALGDEGVDDSWVTTDEGVEVHGTWAATSPSYAATHGLGGRAFSNWEDQPVKSGDTNNKHGQTKRRWGVRRGATIARMRWTGGPGGHKAKPRVVQALTMMGWPIEISHPHASEMVTSILEHTWNRGFLLEMRDAIHAMVSVSAIVNPKTLEPSTRWRGLPLRYSTVPLIAPKSFSV